VTEPRCRELAELRSAYLDGALGDAERERVLAHLSGCASCRAELDELRQVRAALRRVADSTPRPPTSPELAARLVSIAGGDAAVPVWSRPFRRTRPGSLPQSRRAARVRNLAAVAALGSVASMVVMLGYVAAPREVSAIGDPTARVTSEFAATLSQFPLTSRSVSAVMMTPDSKALAPAPAAHVPPSEAHRGRSLTSTAVMGVLDSAVERADQVAYRGEQLVTTRKRGQQVTATVQVDSRAVEGSAVSVLGRDGRSVLEGSIPGVPAVRVSDRDMLSLLRSNFALSGWTGDRVAGRPATVVQASRTGAGGSRPAARWWVDDETGILLAQENYDDAGGVAQSARFTHVRISSQVTFRPHLSPQLATLTTKASLTLSNATDLASRGWYCQGRLAGLSLVRLRSDQAGNPSALHMVYGDGVTTLSVFEQRGRLAAAPSGSVWEDSIQAFVRPGSPTMASWRSGDTVFTVVTDGDLDLVREAVASLPHEPYESPTTMGRVRAGWGRIIESVVG